MSLAGSSGYCAKCGRSLVPCVRTEGGVPMQFLKCFKCNTETEKKPVYQDWMKPEAPR